MDIQNIKVIVPGSLNTDIIGFGVDEIIGKGELTLGGQLKIAPGGKSRNIAQMIAACGASGAVAMIGITSQDPFGLWQPPIDALKNAHVHTKFIKILSFSDTQKYPGIALIPVDKQGHNQIYVLPGISTDFSKDHIDNALPSFEAAQKNNGLLVLSLELPLATGIHAIKQAKKHGLKVILDPGGIRKDENYDELLAQDIFVVKPNEHEAEILTGIQIKDFESAQKAASILLEKNIKNVLITVGASGAYFFNASTAQHIPALKMNDSPIKDETGCGDQTTATLSAMLLDGKDIVNAATIAVHSGGLQFQRAGVDPLSKEDINKLAF